jgi:uncharacterized ion transporter superfamily protein YfcC
LWQLTHDTVRRVTLRVPHPFVLLLGGIVVAAALSHVLPAGEYERRHDPDTGRNVVVAGSYHSVSARPVGPFEMLIAVPKGMVDAGSVIFLIFLAGGAFSVIDRTGAFQSVVHWLSARFRHRTFAIIPIVSLLFATAGAIDGFWEEVVALVPVLLLLARRVGFDGLTIVSMSLGAAGIGGAFSPFNPFSVGIAQRLAELPLLSGLWFRLAVLAPALAIWVWGTMRHATWTRTTPEDLADGIRGAFDMRQLFTLLALVTAFAVYVFGTLRYSWGFDELSALFLLVGIVAGLVAGLGVSDTADAFVDGFKAMAYAALVVGVARAIFVVLGQGRIVDTIIEAMVAPLANLSTTSFAIGMSFVQTGLALPVPSSSGRAVLTIPILVPVSDLLGLSRQVTVLAYQYGPGLLGQFSPTEGALMATLALAGVRYEQWLRFSLPLCAILFVLSLLALTVAVTIGLA